MTNLFKMKQNLSELGKELTVVTEEVRTKAANPEIEIAELRTVKERQSEVEERFNMLKAEIEKAEKEERAKLEAQNPVAMETNEEKRMAAAKAELIRSAITGKELSNETRNLLAALPANHASGGAKFLPTNMQNTLVHEPFVKNPLRAVIGYSNIKGLELPKIAYSLDDDAFITDEQTAKEITLTGDTISFGRFKSKIKARISDTVLHGSDLNLTQYVENALQSGLAAKEKKVAFAGTPTVGEEHMSFYSTQNAIVEVDGETTYKAIKAAIADLHEDYRENAVIVMKYADYSDMIETLANGNATLYNAQPEQVLGKPVVFSDSATKPIVLDPNYVRFNYDGAMTYDSDKDVDKGEYLFVLTAWFDMQIVLKSAVRIANVVPGV